MKKGSIMNINTNHPAYKELIKYIGEFLKPRQLFDDNGCQYITFSMPARDFQKDGRTVTSPIMVIPFDSLPINIRELF